MIIFVATCCYTGKGEELKIVIVTSSSGRWIIPKGQVEKDLKKREVAIIEMWEEAGIIGTITGKPKEFIIDRQGEALWKIYPVQIIRLEEKWPEKKLRERRLVSPEEAMELIDNEDLSAAIKKLVKKIRKK